MDPKIGCLPVFQGEISASSFTIEVPFDLEVSMQSLILHQDLHLWEPESM
jgi:hypothetical protein